MLANPVYTYYTRAMKIIHIQVAVTILGTRGCAGFLAIHMRVCASDGGRGMVM